MLYGRERAFSFIHTPSIVLYMWPSSLCLRRRSPTFRPVWSTRGVNTWHCTVAESRMQAAAPLIRRDALTCTVFCRLGGIIDKMHYLISVVNLSIHNADKIYYYYGEKEGCDVRNLPPSLLTKTHKRIYGFFVFVFVFLI